MPHTPPSSDDMLPPEWREGLSLVSHRAGELRSSVDVDHAAQLASERMFGGSGRESLTKRDAIRHRVSAKSLARRHMSLRMWLAGALFAGFAAISLVRPFATRRDQSSSRQYSTTIGQRATVTLTDGSRMTLGPSTRMTVIHGTHGTSVTLDGEALFFVVQRPNAPFTVRTTHSIATVLGTTFLVRRYPTDAATRVFVKDGRVAVRAISNASGSSAVVNAQAVAFVSDSGAVRVESNASSDEYTGWAAGVLRFNDALLCDVANDLSRAYGVEIRVTDSALAAQRIKWGVQTNRTSLAQVLEQLRVMLDLHAVRRDGKILLVPGRVPVPRTVPSRRPLTAETYYGR